MNIDVIFSANEVTKDRVEGKIVVVIDVLRATSVMLTAMNNGAVEIRPFKEINKLISYTKDLKGILRCGERNGTKIVGFDLGNSPLEYKSEIVHGKIICMTTSNGTNALVNSSYGKKIFIGSFFNLDLLCKKINEIGEDLVIVCAGTNGEFSLDDSLCAGEIVKRLEYRTLSDSARAMYMIASIPGTLKDKLKETKHYNFLKELGEVKDLENCFSVDSQNIILEYRDGIIKKYEE
ncbi:2-phosphosulfolactate phosphatase [Psychrilyobacter atlanticus]|uniref:2-phosphosulfolactate phosphatase n=1 Tax=Psychrilyobacter atlanticus TaxID=271091 RepID=UPI000409923E|nr:2-phosphosulfolactate phosphatase [Psychrilyobacter atlanticus]